MNRVRNALKVKAREAAKDLMIVSDNPELVMDTLQKKFGRPDYIIKNLLNKAHALKYLKDGEIGQISIFSKAIKHFVAIVKSFKKPSYLTNIMMDEFIGKLTENYHHRWAIHLDGKSMDDFTLKDFSNWIAKEAELMENISCSLELPKANTEGREDKKC